jgi:hypothetical protein
MTDNIKNMIEWLNDIFNIADENNENDDKDNR